jgi:hypothetical protein
VFLGGNAKAWHANLEAFLERQVEDADRAWGLTAAQEEKLRLAGRGDMKRMFDRVEEMRREWVGMALADERSRTIHEEFTELRIAIRPLPVDGRRWPIFTKVLGKITDEKRASK